MEDSKYTEISSEETDSLLETRPGPVVLLGIYPHFMFSRLYLAFHFQPRYIWSLVENVANDLRSATFELL